jgi:putative endonuclease
LASYCSLLWTIPCAAGAFEGPEGKTILRLRLSEFIPSSVESLRMTTLVKSGLRACGLRCAEQAHSDGRCRSLGDQLPVEWAQWEGRKMTHTVYILECADGSFYTGMTKMLELRLTEHQSGSNPRAYTYSRRPVRLVWSQDFESEHQAFERERQVKGWSRAKKLALIRGHWDMIHKIVEEERASREKKDRRCFADSK